MRSYDVEFKITVVRVFADPNRPPKSFSDRSVKTVEAENEDEAMEKAFDEAVLELTGISGITPDIDKPNWKFHVRYENGSGTEYSDFRIAE